MEAARHRQGDDTSWEAHLQDVPLGLRSLLVAHFAGGKICSPLKYPFLWSLMISFLECHLPDPWRCSSLLWVAHKTPLSQHQQVFGGPGCVWGWIPTPCTHKAFPSPATEWKIPAFQAYVIWEEVNGSAIYIQLFGDFAAAFALQSPCGVGKELN